MKALTIWPEWYIAFKYFGKDVENRVWKPSNKMIGETIALHAGCLVGGNAKVDILGYCCGGDKNKKFYMNCIEDMLETVKYVKYAGYDCYVGGSCIYNDNEEVCRLNKIPFGSIFATAKIEFVERRQRFVGHYSNGEKYSRWHFYDQYGWKLKDVKFLSEAIRCRGRQRLWDIPSDIEKRIHV